MRKTVKAKLKISKEEEKLFEDQWKRWNKAIDDKDVKLYSALKQQIKWDDIGSRGHPVVLRNDVFSVTINESFSSVKIPHKDVYGGIKVPVQIPYRYHELMEKGKICDSQLRPEKDSWYIHIVIEFDVDVSRNPSPDVVIGVDLGERHLATSVALVNGEIVNPEYHDQGEGRRIRSHYHRLRRQLQKNKKWEALQKISGKQERTMDYLCHRISREIVDKAKKHVGEHQEVAVAVGDLKGIRDEDWGSKGNRRKDSFPFSKLKQYIQYKAEEAGIPCELVNEAYTSKTCNRCGEVGTRHSQGKLVCNNEKCEIQEYNCDMNAAINIGCKLSRKLRKPLWEKQGGIGDAPKATIQT